MVVYDKPDSHRHSRSSERGRKNNYLNADAPWRACCAEGSRCIPGITMDLPAPLFKAQP